MNWLSIGAVSTALAIVCGAFGAHGIEQRVPPHDFETWKTGVLYHVIGAIGLVLLGLHDRAGRARVAGLALLAGQVVFSGTLYGIVLGGPRWLGAITPIGGVLLIVGWLAFAWNCRRPRRS
jgi:uncharacterized membrane protein YgdD (TMEM256/DUF423 family)